MTDVDRWHRWLTGLNTTGHRAALTLFLVIVLAHWAEHITQAVQIWVLGWPESDAGGVLGVWFPWMVTSEALHYGYALVMLVGLALLRPGFTAQDRTWWNVALGIQAWHHVEHFVLLIQAQSGLNLLGRSVPTSIVQVVVPRVELHLFYNAVVFAPMVVAMFLHRWRLPEPRPAISCSCAVAHA